MGNGSRLLELLLPDSVESTLTTFPRFGFPWHMRSGLTRCSRAKFHSKKNRLFPLAWSEGSSRESRSRKQKRSLKGWRFGLVQENRIPKKEKAGRDHGRF